MDDVKDTNMEHNAMAARYHEMVSPIVAAMTAHQSSAALAAWKGGIRGKELGLAMQAMLHAPKTEFPEAFGVAVVTRALEIADEYDEDLRPDTQNEERVPMAEFENAVLYYIPARHTYRVELGDLFEEFRAGWEPLFGIDTADAQVAEEVLDRLLSKAASR